ncbi:hypothetical protein [Roseicyclus sp.]|uniref:hypothetical protein n=1 Tax=Roseicyclus sp. TaxID=1914329 RepID=UPI003F6C90E8
MMQMPALLSGKRVAILGSARGLGLAVAKAATEAGAEVIGIDAVTGFDHVSEFYHIDPSHVGAIDRLAAALPDGLDGLCLLPAYDASDAPDLALMRGVMGPKRLAEGIAPRMAAGAVIVTQGAAFDTARAQYMALIRAALALRTETATGFAQRWGLMAEPVLTPKLIGWAMEAWAMQHRAAWGPHGPRSACLVTASPDGRLPPAICAARGIAATTGQQQAAAAAVFLLSALASGLTGATLAADGGLSAETQTSLEGL